MRAKARRVEESAPDRSQRCATRILRETAKQYEREPTIRREAVGEARRHRPPREHGLRSRHRARTREAPTRMGHQYRDAGRKRYCRHDVRCDREDRADDRPTRHERVPGRRAGEAPR